MYNSFDNRLSINEANVELQVLIRTQDAVVDLLTATAKNVASDKQKASEGLSAGVRAIVRADDADRYAALTRASKDDGASYNFTAVVADWVQKDIDNRKERASLEEKWGTRQEVAHKAAEVKEGIDLIASALAEISPEIAQFDVTSGKIKKHNEKYKDKPKLQINQDSYDNYSKFGWKGVGRFLLWLVGYRGPHRAYKVVSEYNKNFGNYYDDALEIADRRKNEKKLQGEQATKQAEYDNLSAIGNRMSTLDRTYRGSQGIARDIGGLVLDLVSKSARFVRNLLSEVPGAEADQIALNALKVASLAPLETLVNAHYKNAKETLTSLQSPLDTFRDAIDEVGTEHISYDFGTLKSGIDKAARSGRTAAAAINGASDTIETFQSSPNAAYDSVKASVDKVTSIRPGEVQLIADLSGLESKVSSKLEEYRAEQRRLAEIERLRREAEAARERARLQEQFDSVARRTTTTTYDSGPSISETPTTSIGIGSGGITQRGGSSGIGMGSRGISGR